MTHETKRRFPWTVAVLAAVFLFLDLGLKRLALLQQLNWSAGPLELRPFLNTGIVFSLPVPKSLYLPVAGILLLVILFLLVASIRQKSHRISGLLLIVLGASSNFRDNIRLGATIDYLIFFNYSAINLADLMIMAGVLLLALNRDHPKKLGK